MLTVERFMREAIAEAKLATGEVPVGAVIVKDGRIIAQAHNERETEGPLAHAEMLAIHRASQALATRRLHGCTLYVTLEPCPMCAGAMLMAQIDCCIFGAFDSAQGCCGSVYAIPEDPAFSWRVQCAGGVCAEECAALLHDFFADRRK